MIKWDSTRNRLLEQNPNISAGGLALIIGCNEKTVLRRMIRVGINPGAESKFHCGIRYLRVNESWNVWGIVATIRGEQICVGCSVNFDTAIGILDAFLYARERGWI